MNEFDFRYSNRVALGIDDAERSTRAVKRIVPLQPEPRYMGSDEVMQK